MYTADCVKLLYEILSARRLVMLRWVDNIVLAEAIDGHGGHVFRWSGTAWEEDLAGDRMIIKKGRGE